MKAFIVDDEAPVRQTIVLLLNRWFPQIEIAGEAAGVTEAVEKIDLIKPDILFLDIEIRGGTGFHILQRIQYKEFKLIFITAFNEYALQAIKMGAVDYLLKPINETEFRTSVHQIIQKVNPTSESKVNSQFAADIKTTGKLVLRTLTDIHIVEVKDIIHCVSDNTYTTFYFSNKEKLLVSKSLSEYEGILEKFGFVRVHQSHLVNVNCIKRIEKTEGGLVYLNDGSSVPVSSRRKPLLLELIGRL